MHLPALSFLLSSISPPTSSLMEQESTEMAHISFPVSGAVALTACTAMSVLYVAILYSPTLILRLPPPACLQEFMIRRFICAVVSSIVSVFLSALLLPKINFWETSSIFGVYGIRPDHLWQAVLFPLSLTSLMYIGSFVSKFLFLMGAWRDDKLNNEACLFKCITRQLLLGWISSISSNVFAWRTYVVAPLTEELVFRACMIPLLLCGGFKTYNIVFLSPIFFSLAHLNHFLELYYQQNYSFVKVALMLGLQLGYTVIFGSYASFLFIRTAGPGFFLGGFLFLPFFFGLLRHLLSPIVAHVFCNVMGLPVLSSPQGKGMMTISFLAGLLCFLWLLFPATSPDLYNDRLDDCRCWQGFCNWK